MHLDFFIHVMIYNDLFALFMHYNIFMAKFGNGRVFSFYLHCSNYAAYGMWLLMLRHFLLSGSQKVYTNLDINVSANISVIGFQI